MGRPIRSASHLAAVAISCLKEPHVFASAVTDLPRHALAVHVGGEVPEGRVLLREHVEAGRLEGDVVRGDDAVGRVLLGQRLQHHLGVGDLAEPALAHDLQDVELVREAHLRMRTGSEEGRERYVAELAVATEISAMTMDGPSDGHLSRSGIKRRDKSFPNRPGGEDVRAVVETSPTEPPGAAARARAARDGHRSRAKDARGGSVAPRAGGLCGRRRRRRRSVPATANVRLSSQRFPFVLRAGGPRAAAGPRPPLLRRRGALQLPPPAPAGDPRGPIFLRSEPNEAVRGRSEGGWGNYPLAPT
ncbi:Protein of unknown function [Gryllus bimaculatus]|nr:Protein of unknown function [Gryllus bimaculatus]